MTAVIEAENARPEIGRKGEGEGAERKERLLGDGRPCNEGPRVMKIHDRTCANRSPDVLQHEVGLLTEVSLACIQERQKCGYDIAAERSELEWFNCLLPLQ